MVSDLFGGLTLSGARTLAISSGLYSFSARPSRLYTFSIERNFALNNLWGKVINMQSSNCILLYTHFRIDYSSRDRSELLIQSQSIGRKLIMNESSSLSCRTRDNANQKPHRRNSLELSTDLLYSLGAFSSHTLPVRLYTFHLAHGFFDFLTP